MSPFATPERKNLALKSLNGGTFGYEKDEHHFNYVFQLHAHMIWDIWKMPVSFNKCLGTDALRTSPLTSPQNAQNLAMKSLTGGTFGYKKGWEQLQFCLPRAYTHHIIYTYERCLYHSGSVLFLMLREWVRSPLQSAKILLWNHLTEGRLAIKRMSVTLIISSNCMHTWYGIYCWVVARFRWTQLYHLGGASPPLHTFRSAKY